MLTAIIAIGARAGVWCHSSWECTRHAWWQTTSAADWSVHRSRESRRECWQECRECTMLTAEEAVAGSSFAGVTLQHHQRQHQRRARSFSSSSSPSSWSWWFSLLCVLMAPCIVAGQGLAGRWLGGVGNGMNFDSGMEHLFLYWGRLPCSHLVKDCEGRYDVLTGIW